MVKVKYKFPFQVKMILLGLFFREMRYSLRSSVLFDVMLDQLEMNHRTSKRLFHTYECVYGGLLLTSAVIADSYLGHKNQFFIYIVIIISIGYMPFLLSLSVIMPDRWLSFNIGNSIITIFKAMVAPVFVPLVGDQLNLPAQYLTLRKYVICAYWIRNIAAIFGTIVPPIVIGDLPLCTRHNCYPIIYFFSYCTMIIEGTLMLAVMNKIIRKKMAIKNVLYKSLKAIFTAIYVKFKTKKKEKHWLDHASYKYDKVFLDDVKRLKVVYMLIPVVVYRTMFTQQQTAWQFQANRMNGYIGIYFISGDLMYAFNPILVVILTPIFYYYIYPLCAKKNWLVTPLQRICAGGHFYTIAYILSAIVYYYLNKEKTNESCEKGHCCLYIYNPNSCSLKVNSSIFNVTVAPMTYEHLHIHSEGNHSYTFESSCGENVKKSDFLIKENIHMGFFWTKNNELIDFIDNPKESHFGDPVVRILSNARNNLTFFKKRLDYSQEEGVYTPIYYDTDDVYPGKYYYASTKDSKDGVEFLMMQGGVYVLLLNQLEDKTFEFNQLEITESNKIHVFWMIPQYFMGVIAEILIMISYNEFCYMESPIRMKSFTQSIMLCMNALNNPLILLVDWLFKKPILVNFFFIGLNIFTTLTFTLLSWHYTCVFQRPQPQEENVND